MKTCVKTWIHIWLHFFCHSAQRIAILSQKLEFLSRHTCVNQSQLEELVKVRPRSHGEWNHLPSGFEFFELQCSCSVQCQGQFLLFHWINVTHSVTGCVTNIQISPLEFGIPGLSGFLVLGLTKRFIQRGHCHHWLSPLCFKLQQNI